MLQNTIMALLPSDRDTWVILGVHLRHMRLVMPVFHVPMIDKTQGPPLDWFADGAPDIDLRVSDPLSQEILRAIRQQFAHAVLARHVVAVDVRHGQGGVG